MAGTLRPLHYCASDCSEKLSPNNIDSGEFTRNTSVAFGTCSADSSALQHARSEHQLVSQSKANASTGSSTMEGSLTTQTHTHTHDLRSRKCRNAVVPLEAQTMLDTGIPAVVDYLPTAQDEFFQRACHAPRMKQQTHFNRAFSGLQWASWVSFSHSQDLAVHETALKCLQSMAGPLKLRCTCLALHRTVAVGDSPQVHDSLLHVTVSQPPGHGLGHPGRSDQYYPTCKSALWYVSSGIV